MEIPGKCAAASFSQEGCAQPVMAAKVEIANTAARRLTDIICSPLIIHETGVPHRTRFPMY
jgi:hypothetical protein